MTSPRTICATLGKNKSAADITQHKRRVNIIKAKVIRTVHVNAIDYILLALIALFIGFSLGQVMQTTKLGAEAQTLRHEVAVLRAEQEHLRLLVEGRASSDLWVESILLSTADPTQSENRR